MKARNGPLGGRTGFDQTREGKLIVLTSRLTIAMFLEIEIIDCIFNCDTMDCMLLAWTLAKG